jgi:hypothetical protein
MARVGETTAGNRGFTNSITAASAAIGMHAQGRSNSRVAFPTLDIRNLLFGL